MQNKISLAARRYLPLLGCVLGLFFYAFRFSQPLAVGVALGRQTILLGFFTLGAGLSVISGDFDLSFAAQGSMVTLLLVWGLGGGVPLPLAVALCLVASVLYGAVKGLLFALLDVPAVLVSFALQTITTGLLAYFSAGDIVIAARSLRSGRTTFWVAALAAFCLLALACWLLLNHTYLGRLARAVGENRNTVRENGLSLVVIKTGLHMVAGLFIGAGGVFVALQAGAGGATLGGEYLYQVVMALCLGRVSLLGGRGGLGGLLLGALCAAMAVMALMSLGLVNQLLIVAEGGLIVLMLALDVRERRGQVRAAGTAGV